MSSRADCTTSTAAIAPHDVPRLTQVRPAEPRLGGPRVLIGR